MGKLLHLVIVGFKKILSKILAFFFCRNKKYFYDEYHGTMNPVVLLIKNIFDQTRFWAKARYGQVCFLPQFFVASKPIQNHRKGSPEFDKLLEKYAEDFKRDGVVILHDHFTSEVNELRNRYRIDKKFCDRNATYIDKRYDLRKEDLICKIALDPLVMMIMARKFRCQPIVRSQPFIISTFPEISYAEFAADHAELCKKDEKKGNMNWHYDTPSQYTCHVLLEDSTLETTHMLVAKKTSEVAHMYADAKTDYYYSEEYVRSRCEVVPCIGKKGTAIIFDNNALHRMNPVKNAYRCLLTTLYTPGNSRFWVAPKGAHPSRLLELQDGIDRVPAPDLDQLTEFQRMAFQWFPNTEEEAKKFVKKGTYKD